MLNRVSRKNQSKKNVNDNMTDGEECGDIEITERSSARLV
jgi:hypothetical protein